MRKALRRALVLRPVTAPRRARPPLYGEAVIEALRFDWAVQGTPCGRLLAASLSDLVPRLRRLGELEVTDDTADLLLKIVPATIDPRGRSHTKPGTLLAEASSARVGEGAKGCVPPRVVF